MSARKNLSWDPASLLRKVLLSKIAEKCPHQPGKSREAKEQYAKYVESASGRFLDLLAETLSGDDKTLEFEKLGKEQGRSGAEHNWKLDLILWPFLAVRDELSEHFTGDPSAGHVLEQLIQSTDVTTVAASQALLDDKAKSHRAREKELSHLAATDELTQLPNRRKWNSQFQTELDRAKRHSRDLSIARIDVDNFKAYNDTYGHEFGDSLLRHVSEVLESSMRRSDFLSRFGGDEFSIALPETPPTSALQVAERMRSLMEKSKWQEHQVTVSVGVSGYPLHGDTYSQLMSQADAALYASKQAGGNRVTMSQLEEEAAIDRERRHYPRQDVTWNAQIYMEANKIGETLGTFPAQIVNASLGGFLIMLGQQLMPRTEVKLDLSFPKHDKPLSTSGSVVWSKSGDQPAAGIQLINLPEPYWQILRQHMQASATSG